MASGKITNYDDLEKWFLKNDLPYYTVYNGLQKSSRSYYDKNNDENDTERAWENLKASLQLKLSEGGSVFIKAADKPNSGYGFETRFEIDKAAATSGGIGGINGNGMYVPGVGNVTPQIEAFAQKEVNTALKFQELKNEIQGLKDSQKAELSIFNKLLEFCDTQAGIVAAQFIAPQISKVIGALTPSNQTPTQPNAANIGSSGSEDVKDQGLIIADAIDRLQTVFDDPIGILERLSIWAEANPDMARSVIGNLK